MNIITLTDLFTASIEYTPMKNANKHGNALCYADGVAHCTTKDWYAAQ